MFRKSFFGLAAVAVLVLASGMTAYAQIQITSGTVELIQADGTHVPVADAQIDSYRTDAKAGFPKTKTDKKGQFSIAGYVLGGVYALAVSAPNCSPTIFPNVRGGMEKLLITMQPGDGRRFTEEEVRKAVASGVKPVTDGGKPVTSGADKAALDKEKADYEAKVAEVNEKNKKAADNYDKINLLLKEAAAAVVAKNYDLAISKYDEGIAIEPNFVGSTPVLLNNRGTSLRQRAVDTYNKSVKLTDATEKLAGYTSVKKDLLDAADSHFRSWKMAHDATTAEIKDPAFNENNKSAAVNEAREAFRIAVLTEQVEPGIIESAKVMIPEYIALEPDAAKKTQAMVLFADLYRVGYQQADAVVIYKKVLETSPDNLDALNGAGLCLVNLGFIDIENAKTPVNKVLADEGKAKLQEGANLLQKFASLAPDTNKFKADAVGLIETLKKEQNVTAVKPSGGGKKKP